MHRNDGGTFCASFRQLQTKSTLRLMIVFMTAIMILFSLVHQKSNSALVRPRYHEKANRRSVNRTLCDNEHLHVLNEILEFTQMELVNVETELNKLRREKANHRKSGKPSYLRDVSRSRPCRYQSCFNYSRCSMFEPFRAFVYEPMHITSSPAVSATVNVTRKALSETSYVTNDPREACIFIVIIARSPGDEVDEGELERLVQGVKYWGPDGSNHLIVSLMENEFTSNVLSNADTGRAIHAQSFYTVETFREGFDIIFPPLTLVANASSQTNPPRFAPAWRKYTLSFQGSLNNLSSTFDPDITPIGVTIFRALTKMSSKEDVHIGLSMSDTSCITSKYTDWCLYGSEEKRLELLSQSTFVLILVSDPRLVTSSNILTRIIEAFRSGGIPVVLGEHAVLPYSEFIDWNRAAILLPLERLSELYRLLRTIHDSDVLSFRRQGSIIFKTYFSNPTAVFSGMLATIRTRISVPADPITGERSKDLFPPGTPRKTKNVTQIISGTDDTFPAAMLPFASRRFLRNFSVTYADHHRTWNNEPGPFFLFPSSPYDPLIPTDALYRGSSDGYKTDVVGSTNAKFLESLGGNLPEEQFTIVILTYQREKILVSVVETLMGLPFLNKVIIVWNSPEPPSKGLIWPKIHVPVKVLQAGRNSLNNRFLPFEEIETDAVLSIDDDIQLRHDEILIQFRVWRENRDRIVGLPSRTFKYDKKTKSFHYVWPVACDYSMVLTGAAFVHKYFLYQYSYNMPKEIRDMVDEEMNCEDIALNFLVSHLSRKPPIKVTSRGGFVNPKVKGAISTKKTHLEGRNKCFETFLKAYGYNPLLTSQFRADSVLMSCEGNGKCFKKV